MTKFENAFNYMIQYEGDKFVDHPNDKGGATKFGISEKFVMEHTTSIGFNIEAETLLHPGFSVKTFIRNLIQSDAEAIYKKYFWLPIYEKIETQDIANYIFDMAVNHGHKNAAIIVQRAIRAASLPIKEDGIIGKETLKYLNFENNNTIDVIVYAAGLFVAMHSERAGFMRCIVAANPSQKVFLEGWLKRAYGEKL